MHRHGSLARWKAMGPGLPLDPQGWGSSWRTTPWGGSRQDLHHRVSSHPCHLDQTKVAARPYCHGLPLAGGQEQGRLLGKAFREVFLMSSWASAYCSYRSTANLKSLPLQEIRWVCNLRWSCVSVHSAEVKRRHILHSNRYFLKGLKDSNKEVDPSDQNGTKCVGQRVGSQRTFSHFFGS